MLRPVMCSGCTLHHEVLAMLWWRKMDISARLHLFSETCCVTSQQCIIPEVTWFAIISDLSEVMRSISRLLLFVSSDLQKVSLLKMPSQSFFHCVFPPPASTGGPCLWIKYNHNWKLEGGAHLISNDTVGHLKTTLSWSNKSPLHTQNISKPWSLKVYNFLVTETSAVTASLPLLNLHTQLKPLHLDIQVVPRGIELMEQWSLCEMRKSAPKLVENLLSHLQLVDLTFLICLIDLHWFTRFTVSVSFLKPVPPSFQGLRIARTITVPRRRRMACRLRCGSLLDDVQHYLRKAGRIFPKTPR